MHDLPLAGARPFIFPFIRLARVLVTPPIENKIQKRKREEQHTANHACFVNCSVAQLLVE